MKPTYLKSYEVCNTNGDEIIVDLLLLEAENGDRSITFFTPGTVEEADEENPDDFDFHEAEMDAWFESAAAQSKSDPTHIEGFLSGFDGFLSSVENLIVADENREDTSVPARSIREFLVDVLGRKDPLNNM